MNAYFYRLFLPFTALSLLAFTGLASGFLHLHWGLLIASWFLIGPIGIGVGYHRLFSHRQFETSRPIELCLALLGTLAAYAPLLFWVSNHQYHHRRSDQIEDPSSPLHHGFWESFLWYRLRKKTLTKIDLENYCSRRVILDRRLRWMSRHFLKIVWFTVFLLGAFSFDVLVSGYILPVFIEHIRINIVSSLSHLQLPFSYRNFETEDKSYNNLVLGYLTMGFAWHNNHHQDSRRLMLNERWWEFDVEGLVGRALSRPAHKKLAAEDVSIR